ncbi:peptidase S24/S26A/S26B/S26C [Phlebopus sp. FC_14]|nr:peptidase S24/S26A/S26B/S26C [Phlebopus sp. FC_14]
MYNLTRSHSVLKHSRVSSTEEPPAPNATKRTLRGLYWLPIGIAFIQFGFTVKTVKGRSMQPTLNPDTSAWNDIVVLDRFSVFAGRPIKKGDVVTLRDPTDNKKVIIKRVIAVQEDTVKTLPPYPEPEKVIPEGHVWVEGDEPFRTLDSNSFGPVPLALVDAKLSFIIWPLHRMGFLKSPAKPAVKMGVARDFKWYSDMAAFERECRRQARVQAGR